MRSTTSFSMLLLLSSSLLISICTCIPGISREARQFLCKPETRSYQKNYQTAVRDYNAVRDSAGSSSQEAKDAKYDKEWAYSGYKTYVDENKP
uniref:Secreted protein n=1 Tax=Phakopsora pachyrhizi TaxID=170000 RepID=A0A0S1MJN7_PHAPC